MELVNAWGPMLASTAVTVSLVALLWRALMGQLHAHFEIMNARFDALDAKFTARHDAADTRFDALDARFDALEPRFDALEPRFDSLYAEIRAAEDRTQARMTSQIGAVSQLMEARFNGVDHRLGSLESDMGLVKQHLLRTPAA